MSTEEITRDLRHALAEAMAEQGAIWTGLHDHAAGRAVGPFVATMEAAERQLRAIADAHQRALTDGAFRKEYMRIVGEGT